MALLAGKLALHDVASVEALVWKALRDSGASGKLQPAELDDWTADLLGLVWEKSLTYQPGPWSFSKTAYQLCRSRIIDKVRKRNGSSRYRTDGDRLTLSLDAPPAGGPRALAWEDWLVAPEPSSEGDDREGLRAALRGLLEA